VTGGAGRRRRVVGAQSSGASSSAQSSRRQALAAPCRGRVACACRGGARRRVLDRWWWSWACCTAVVDRTRASTTPRRITSNTTRAVRSAPACPTTCPLRSLRRGTSPLPCQHLAPPHATATPAAPAPAASRHGHRLVACWRRSRRRHPRRRRRICWPIGPRASPLERAVLTLRNRYTSTYPVTPRLIAPRSPWSCTLAANSRAMSEHALGLRPP